MGRTKYFLALVFCLFVGGAMAQQLILQEQFSVKGTEDPNQTSYDGSITIGNGNSSGETIANTYFEPRMTTLGYGGWFDSHDSGRYLEVRYRPAFPASLKSTEWYSSNGHAGYLDFWDSPDTKGSYAYTPLLKKPIDLSQAGAKIQWDAHGSNRGDYDVGIRIMLRTELGWILSSRVVAKPKYGSFTMPPTTSPVYNVNLNTLYDSWVSILDKTPTPDLDGRVNGFTNDATSLTLGAAVNPDLKYVTGFGFYIDDATSPINDLCIDGIKVTGAVPVVYYGAGTLTEQFSVNQAKTIIPDSSKQFVPVYIPPSGAAEDHHTSETICGADSHTSLTTTGWGGFMTTDTAKSLTLQTGNSTAWVGNDGANGYASFSGNTTDTAVGSYIYTPRLARAANLAFAGSKIEWDANADVATTFGMRVIIRTLNDGWLLSDPIVGNLHDRDVQAWSAAGEAPAFSADMASRTWTWIKNARFNTAGNVRPETCDLDGCTGDGYANDAYRLILDVPVATPDLTNVISMGLYVDSSMVGTGDLHIDGIRITGGFKGGAPNMAQHWEVLD